MPLLPEKIAKILSEQAKKKRRQIFAPANSVLKNTVAPAVSTTAGMVGMYNDQLENPNIATGIISGAAQQGALGYQAAGLKGLIGGGILGGITSGITTLNRAEQKYKDEQDEYLNKMYGSVVGEDYDLQYMLHGKKGGEVMPPDGESEFVPIQTEARMVKVKNRNGRKTLKLVKEKLAFQDGRLADVNADKPHSQMPKDAVTDVVAAGTYVFPVFTKLTKKDLNSLITYGQGNYSENGKNIEVSEIRLKDVLGEDFEGSFAEAADLIDKKYPLKDVSDRTNRVDVVTNDENNKHRMAYISHLARLNEAKLNGEEVQDVTIEPEVSLKRGGWIRKMKTGGIVGDPPGKKSSYSWSTPVGEKPVMVKPVTKSQHATSKSKETQHDINKRQEEINKMAKSFIGKKTEEFTDEEIDVINQSTLPGKDKVARDYRIYKSNEAQKKDDSWTAEGFKNSTAALGDKLSLQRIPVVGDYIPGFFDVTGGIGSMAAGLGEIPYEVDQGNYGRAATKVAVPLVAGALGGVGTKTVGQFANNMVNPFAGFLPRKKGIVTPEGFQNRVFKGNIQLGSYKGVGHLSEKGFNYRTLSQKEIEAIRKNKGVFPKEGKAKGGNENVKYWTEGNERNWYGDKDGEVIRVSQDNFNPNKIVDAKHVEVYNKNTGKFESISDFNSSSFKSEIDWAKWNKEIPVNKSLMQEYNAIEQAHKEMGTWMKNPDGSAFKGTPEQFVQQNSENFKKAFGSSKLINPDGSPTIQYHGSAKKFDIFDESKFQLGDSGYTGQGIYTTPSKTIAESYSKSSAKFHTGEIEPTVYELYGQANNPISSSKLIKDGGKRDLFNFHRKRNWKGDLTPEESLMEYDAAISDQLPNVENIRPWHDAREIVFPSNKQLKSAIGNNGMFDMTDPNIYKSLIPLIGYASYLKSNKNEK